MNKSFFPALLALITLFAFQTTIQAQFSGGATVTNSQLASRAWHITNKRDNFPMLVQSGSGVSAVVTPGLNAQSTFIATNGPNDGLWYTADVKYFQLKNLATGLFLTIEGTTSGSTVDLQPDNSSAGQAGFNQMFELIPAPSGSGWYKLRSRLSNIGPDLVLDVDDNGQLIAATPQAGAQLDQKFAFNLQLPFNDGARYSMVGINNHDFISDNGIDLEGTQVVHIKDGNPSVIWNLIPTGDGYYYLFNLLTQRHLGIGSGDLMVMTGSSGDDAKWEMIRADDTFKFKNKQSGDYIGTAGLTADGQPLHREGSLGTGIKWIVSRLTDQDGSVPSASYNHIADAPSQPNCISFGNQFKQALAERIGLPADQIHFVVIQDAVGAALGNAQIDETLRKFDMNDPGHRVDLAVMMRNHILNDIALRPRNTWTGPEQAVVAWYEQRIHDIRVDFANRLAAAWTNYNSTNNTGTWGMEELLSVTDADGFVWPCTYNATTSQQDLLTDYLLAANSFGASNPQVRPGYLNLTGAVLSLGVGVGIQLIVSANVSSSTLINLTESIALTAGQNVARVAVALIEGGGAIVTVVLIAAQILAAEVQDVQEVQQLLQKITSATTWANQAVHIDEIMQGHDCLAKVRLFDDLDFLMGAPVANGFTHNTNDNLTFPAFTTTCLNGATVNLDATGHGTVLPSQVETMFGDPFCGGPVNFTVTPSQFNCSQMGTQTVTVTGTNSKTTSTCTATVTVQDNRPPDVTCKPASLTLNAAGNASITYLDILQSAVDNCSGVTIVSVAPNTFNCSQIGANNTTLTVKDSHGNTSTCTSVVTVSDNIPPTVVCKNATVGLNASGIANLSTSAVFQSGSDNCGTVNQVFVSPSLFTCNDLGAHSVTLAVNDGHGNNAFCNATVTIVDNLAPSVVCKNATVSLNAAGSGSITTGEVFQSGSDNCGSVNQVSVSPNTFTCANLGANAVTFTANDGHGNTGTCSATVTVVDNMAPSVVCKNATVNLTAAGTASVSTGAVFQSGSDNCGSVNQVSVAPAAFTCANLGNNNVILTVNDGHGNSATCSAVVTVVDNLAPTVTCKNVTTFLNAAGTASIVLADVYQSGTDNCGTVNQVSVSPNSFTCANYGTNTVVFTANDGHGNIGTCSATVTVADAIAPTVVCKNATIGLSASGTATVSTAMVFQSGSDNCGTVNQVSVTPSAFNCSNLGNNVVTLVVNDSHGNTAQCSAIVTVTDPVPPVAKCKNATANLGLNGTVTLQAVSIDNGSSDNCTFGLTVTPSTFTCASLGSNSVTLRVLDAGNNLATCTAIVTVKDITKPTALCKNPTILLDNTGQATITTAQIDNGSTDNCSVAGKTIDNNQFSCSDLGTSRYVILTVTDGSGNTSTCISTVTVKDNTAPTAVCSNATVMLGSNGVGVLYGAYVADQSYDNCAVWSYSPVAKVYTTANLGNNNLAITVKDFSNNAATCVSVVTVVPYGSGNGNAKDRDNAITDAETGLLLFPNPADDHATLQFELTSAQSCQLRLFDLQGRLVLDQPWEGQEGANIIPLNLAGFASGLYMLDLEMPNTHLQKRLGIQR
jgi:hypothetical protein